MGRGGEENPRNQTHRANSPTVSAVIQKPRKKSRGRDHPAPLFSDCLEAGPSACRPPWVGDSEGGPPMNSAASPPPADQARELLAHEHLPFPPLPDHLAARLAAAADHVFASRQLAYGP